MGSGNSDKITREYFENLLLVMRHLDAVRPSTKVNILGKEYETPVMTAALSHLGNTCEDGMVKLAEAAKTVGALYWCGMGEDEELERICATGADVVKIIKPHADNAEVLRKLRHAEASGVTAVGMDIDHAFNGSGEYDVVLGLPMHPKTMVELGNFVRATKLPFLVKGVLSVEDAVKCADIGVAGIVVSHHHGIMEYAVPPLQILPEIVEAVGDRLEIFVDCDFESGMDTFKALALGAKAVGIGRALMGPLKDGGVEGAAAAMARITSELRGVMARTGYAQVDAIDSTCIRKRTSIV